MILLPFDVLATGIIVVVGNDFETCDKLATFSLVPYFLAYDLHVSQIISPILTRLLSGTFLII